MAAKTIRYVAFLRAVNVGKRQVKMEALRELFATRGISNVQTYIQTGNVIFDTAPQDAPQLASSIAKRLEKALGFDVPTMVRTMDEIRAINKAFPFKPEEHIGLYVALLSAPMDKAHLDILKTLNTETTTLQASGDNIFIRYRKDLAKDPFSNALLEKKLKLQSTTRDIKTMRKLEEFV